MPNWTTRLGLAIAAAVVLVIGVGLGVMLNGPIRDAAVLTVAAHKVHEEGLDRGAPAGSPGRFETDPAVLAQLATGGQPLTRWREGLTMDGLEPMPWLKDALNWFPKTEQVQPDEMRVTFMGTSPLIRPGQMNTSIYVELGNGKSFIFDFGDGAVSNYLAAGVPLNRLNDIFLTHLHWDHFGSIPYAYTFGAWGGRWHEPMRITGPSGDRPELGTRYAMDEMKKMLTWHRDSFDLFPIGQGWDMQVNEFDYRDDGGVVYDKDGVVIRHWRQSHGEDGASAYRLDWNGLSMAFTGDGRPNGLTAKYAKGVGLLITEIQPETVSELAKSVGTMPALARATFDIGHNPAYAAGYLYDQVKPRLAMGTHVMYDPSSAAEIFAEVREHWKGPFRLGAPDMVVVNMTRDRVWVRDGILPKYPGISAPQFAIADNGGLVIPAPRHTRSEIQQASIRAAEIDPDKYYPHGYRPRLIEDWPTRKAVYLPAKMVPPAMKGGPVPSH
ncbi:MAG: guanitoxin biosynthesis MBL fold metallo-hydrolase GntH [Caulobacterales bacterium]